MRMIDNKKEIEGILQEGFEEFGGVKGAFNYLLDNWLGEIFECDEWDVPAFDTALIEFQGDKYQVSITEEGEVEHTNEHRIVDWGYDIKKI